MPGKTPSKISKKGTTLPDFENLLSNLPGVVYRCLNNRQWSMVYISNQCESLTGYRQEEIINDAIISFSDLIHSEDRSRAWEVRQSALKDNNTFELEFRIITRKGEEKWIWDRGNAIKDNNGKILNIEGFLVDITDKKISENNLPKQEALIRLATRSQDVILASVDSDLRYTWIQNPHPQFKSSDILGKTDVEINNEKGAKELHELKKRVLESGKSVRKEIIFHLDKGIRVYDIIAVPLKDPNDEISGVTTTSIDVTDRVEYREELEKRNELLNEVGDMALVGGWEVDLENKKVIWTPTTGKIHEVDPDYQPDLETAVSFYPGESGKRIKKAIKEALEKGRDYDLELDFITAKGNQRNVRTIGKTEFKNGRCVRFHGTFQDITSLKTIAEKADKSEHRYQSLFNSIRDAILVASTERKIVDCNETFIELFGYSLEEIRGKETSSIYDSEREFEEMGKAIREHQDQFEDFLFIIHYRKKNGEVFYGETNVYFLKDENAQVIGFIGMIRDISERIKIEKDLKESEARYRSLFENMLNGFAVHKIITDDKGNPVDYEFLEVNRAFEKLTSLKRESILNKRVSEVIPDIADDPSDWINRYGDVALKGKEEKFEAFSKPLGKWFDVLAYSYRDGYFATVFEDITEQKKAQMALGESEARFRGVMENIKLIGLMLDKNANIKFANDYLLDLTGWKREEIMNKNWFEIFIPENIQSNVLKVFKKTVSSGDYPLTYENEIKTKKGELKVIKWNNIFNKNTNEEENYVTSIGEDITEFKKAQEELKKYQDNLESLVEKRTSEIKDKNEQLERMNKLFVGREFRIKQLKTRIEELEKNLRDQY